MNEKHVIRIYEGRHGRPAEIEVEAIGFKGNACQMPTDQIINALGLNVIASKNKQENHRVVINQMN